MEKTITVPDSSEPLRDSQLETFFIEELRELYGAEGHQLGTLQAMKKAACSLRLQSILANHLITTGEQLQRLETVFAMTGRKPDAKSSDTLAGVTAEFHAILEETEEGSATRDVGIIMTAQKIEHYEIAVYGGLVQLARTMEWDEIADILETTLYEEKDADDILTCLAENYINPAASREQAVLG